MTHHVIIQIWYWPWCVKSSKIILNRSKECFQILFVSNIIQRYMNVVDYRRNIIINYGTILGIRLNVWMIVPFPPKTFLLNWLCSTDIMSLKYIRRYLRITWDKNMSFWKTKKGFFKYCTLLDTVPTCTGTIKILLKSIDKQTYIVFKNRVKFSYFILSKYFF